VLDGWYACRLHHVVKIDPAQVASATLHCRPPSTAPAPTARQAPSALVGPLAGTCRTVQRRAASASSCLLEARLGPRRAPASRRSSAAPRRTNRRRQISRRLHTRDNSLGECRAGDRCRDQPGKSGSSGGSSRSEILSLFASPPRAGVKRAVIDILRKLGVCRSSRVGRGPRSRRTPSPPRRTPAVGRKPCVSWMRSRTTRSQPTRLPTHPSQHTHQPARPRARQRRMRAAASRRPRASARRAARAVPRW
jgi:hypothetical protein